MKYENQRPDLADQIKALVQSANSVKTVPHGIKTVNPGEGLQLVSGDGQEIFWDWETAAEYDSRISEGREAIDQAQAELAQARLDLDAGAARVAENRQLLDALGPRVDAAQSQVTQTAQDLTSVDTRLTATAGELSTLKTTVGDVSEAVTASDTKMSELSEAATAANAAAQDALSAASAAEARVQALANAQGSLILSGGFETASDATAAYRYQTDLAKAGSYVGRFTLAEGNKEIVWPDARAAKDQALELRFWARGVGAYGTTTVIAYLVINFGDGTTQSLYATSASIRPSLNGVFQEYVFRFPALPEGTRAVSPRTGVRPDSTATGYVFMDEVTLHDTASYQEALDAAIAAKAAADKAAADALDAMTRANQAYDSAQGKNSIRHATTDPQGVGTSTGDVWWKWTSFPGGVVTGQWAWDGTAWREQKASHQTIASVDLGTATVGQLKGSYIEAGSITVDRLTIGVGGNQLADPFFTDAALRTRRSAASTGTWNYTTTAGIVRMGNPVETTALQVFRYAPLGTAGMIPTTPGRQWRIEVPVYLSSGRARINIRWYDAFGVAFLYEGASPYVSGPGDLKVVADITSPAGAVGYLVDIYMPAETTPRVARIYGGASVVVKNASVHIEDGAVTAEKVNAESVAAAVGQFVKVQAANVEVTEALAARMVNAMTANLKNLVVTESAILQHTTLLGTTVADELNVIGTLRGRDAILDGTVDVAQLNVTGAMSAEIVRTMDAQTKNLVVTEDAIINRATVVQSLVTPELIADKANVQTLAARMVSAGAIVAQDSTGSVQINPTGITVRDAAPGSTSYTRQVQITPAGITGGTRTNPTVNIDGQNNWMVGTFSTAESGQRVKISNNSSVAAVDLYASRSTSDHVGIWYDSPDTNVLNAVGRVLAISGSSYSRDSPGLEMWPMRGTFGFRGRWQQETDATKFVEIFNTQGLNAGAWVQLEIPFQSAFPTNNSLLFPLVSAERDSGGDVVVMVRSVTASRITLVAVNKATSGTSGAIKLRAVVFNLNA